MVGSCWLYPSLGFFGNLWNIQRYILPCLACLLQVASPPTEGIGIYKHFQNEVLCWIHAGYLLPLLQIRTCLCFYEDYERTVTWRFQVLVTCLSERRGTATWRSHAEWRPAQHTSRDVWRVRWAISSPCRGHWVRLPDSLVARLRGIEPPKAALKKELAVYIAGNLTTREAVMARWRAARQHRQTFAVNSANIILYSAKAPGIRTRCTSSVPAHPRSPDHIQCLSPPWGILMNLVEFDISGYKELHTNTVLMYNILQHNILIIRKQHPTGDIHYKICWFDLHVALFSISWDEMSQLMTTFRCCAPSTRLECACNASTISQQVSQPLLKWSSENRWKSVSSPSAHFFIWSCHSYQIRLVGRFTWLGKLNNWKRRQLVDSQVGCAWLEGSWSACSAFASELRLTTHMCLKLENAKWWEISEGWFKQFQHDQQIVTIWWLKFQPFHFCPWFWTCQSQVPPAVLVFAADLCKGPSCGGWRIYPIWHMTIQSLCIYHTICHICYSTYISSKRIIQLCKYTLHIPTWMLCDVANFTDQSNMLRVSGSVGHCSGPTLTNQSISRAPMIMMIQ